MIKPRLFLFRPSIAGILSLLLGLPFARAEFPATTPDPINFDWRFAEGGSSTAMQADFDDSSWESVDLPHDWAVRKPFDPEGNPNTAKLSWKGEGWYRKSFELPAEVRGKRLQFMFDGVMANPTVYLNGQEVGSWIYGYNSFHIDATDAANFGGENVLAVHVDTQAHHSRWYPGAGIYRKISMRLVDPVHIPYWGVQVTTPRVEGEAATVQVEVELANETGSAAKSRIVVEIVDPLGEVVRSENREVEIPAGGGNAVYSFELDKIKRWDVEHPHLYTTKTTVFAGNNMSDNVDTHFGIRTFEWTVDDGFHLNGRRIELQGVNEHHTNGMLGAAFFPRAVERKFEILRDMGVNALRTSHNPEAPEVLELCDRLGIIVFNELYDKWGRTGGVDADTATFVNEYAEREVRNFVRRDRNHPSVMVWSVANEDGAVLTNRDGKSAEHVAKMVSYFKEFDDTRPITMGCHVASGARREWGIFDALDSSGWNYSQRYMNFRKNYPEKAVIYSETASAFGTRGHYELTLPESKTDFGDDGYLSGFIMTAAPWGDIPEHEFERMRKHRFLNGDFVWTGFDYLGEPTPARGINPYSDMKVEARSSYFGIVDLAGLPKDTFYLYRSQWNREDRTVRLSPHWNWSEGDKVPVIIYTDGDEAELFLNGQSIGRKSKLDPDQMQTSNIAYRKTSYASSSQVVQDEGGNVLADNTSDKAFDGDTNTRWSATDATTPQFLKVDLGEESSFKQIRIQWESSAENYDYTVSISHDDENWSPIGGEVSRINELTTIDFDWVEARYVKLQVDGVEGDRWASLSEFEVLDKEPVNRNPYYDIVDAYRIRFFDIPYEPGELKVVAYRDGKKIGEDSVETAGAPAKLEVTPDRTVLKADGMDLCYVTIKMLDEHGSLCPWAMEDLTFETEGAAAFMGVANGNSAGLDALTDDTHPLFYGQAVAVIRSKPGEAGRASLTVAADGFPEAKAEVLFAD